MDGFLDGVIESIIDGKRDVYNPALLYGNTAAVEKIIARFIQDYQTRHPSHKVIHISGEEFARKLILSFQNGTNLDFGKQFDDADLLVFEDAEAIAGKAYAMQVFYGIIDTAYESGRQIVFTATEPPSKINALEDRIRTQLEGGIICEVRAKDLEGAITR